jgi:hypothetical protein
MNGERAKKVIYMKYISIFQPLNCFPAKLAPDSAWLSKNDLLLSNTASLSCSYEIVLI